MKINGLKYYKIKEPVSMHTSLRYVLPQKQVFQLLDLLAVDTFYCGVGVIQICVFSVLEDKHQMFTNVSADHQLNNAITALQLFVVGKPVESILTGSLAKEMVYTIFQFKTKKNVCIDDGFSRSIHNKYSSFLKILSSTSKLNDIIIIPQVYIKHKKNN